MRGPGSGFEADALVLNSRDFHQIRELARGAFGLDLRCGKEELVAARLRRLVRGGGFRSFQDYCRHVAADRSGLALAAMIDALATNHTAFLREPDHFVFLRESVLPEFAGRDLLEIWCAACSTGEEVWSLAMVVSEACPRRRFSILGSDISNRALAAAEAAQYPAERCRAVSPVWLSRYFAPGPTPGGTYAVVPRLRAQAGFRRVNLIEPLPFRDRFPVIFCRNAMIYFDSAVQEQVVERLSGALAPGGYLFVGHAESLTRIHHSLEYVRPAVYRKRARKEGRWSRS